MRRAITSVLLALFGFTLIAPALLANPSSLPACCRREGKHRCGMVDAPDRALSPTAQEWNGAQPKCPVSPKAGNVAGDSQTVLPGDSVGIGVPPLVRSVARIGNDCFASIALLGSAQKRGPPVNLA